MITDAYATGCNIAKPVETQEQCDAYTAMVQAVADHNAALEVGGTLWEIADKDACYEIVAAGTKAAPEETTPEPTVKEQLAALQEQNKMLKQCLLEMSEIVYA